MIRALLLQFTDDPGVRLLTTLVFLDLVLGLCSAAVRGTFRLAFAADFLRADVLGKLFPYFAVWAAVRVGGDLELGGVGAIEESTLALFVGALSGSILNSFDELRLKAQGVPGTNPREAAQGSSSMPDPLPNMIAGGERPPAP